MEKAIRLILIISILFCCQNSFSQSVYKTPSGSRYHLESCRMVENVSKQLLGKDALTKYKLLPCKICKPPHHDFKVKKESTSNKAVGTKKKSLQCKGITKKGARCKHKTKLANGYCYQHSK